MALVCVDYSPDIVPFRHKLNARILRELRILEFGNSEVKLTDFGRLILEIINGR